MIDDALSLDRLRAFSTFSDHLNLTHAAEALQISQPALHAKIQELTRALGVPLYERQGRKLLLTAKGEELAAFARELVERLGGFAHEFRHESPRPVVLAAGRGAYLYLLGEGIRRYRVDSPSGLSLRSGDREACLGWVRSGRAHLGVTVLDEVPSDLQVRLLHESRSVLVCPEHHPLAALEVVGLNDLAGSGLIVPPPHRPHRQRLQAALQQAGVAWEVAVEAEGWDLILHFVQLGLGCAVVNSLCPVPAGLVARPLDCQLAPARYYLFQRRGYLRNEARQLAQHLLACHRGYGDTQEFLTTQP